MFVSFRLRPNIAQLLPSLLAVLLATTSVFGADWIKVGEGKLCGISGMTLLAHRADRTEFLVVHDNKNRGEPRLAVVSVSAEAVGYAPLSWPSGATLPIDLESISAIPDRPQRFLALASGGQLLWLSVLDGAVTLLADFMLPELPARANFEGFSVQKLGNQLVAIWGLRGSGEKPGVLFWGFINLEKKEVREISRSEVRVPFPSPRDPNTRHIADLKVDSNGIVWASATNDPGDDGPFVSAVYTLGVLRPTQNQEIQFEPNTSLTRLRIFPKKVEAIELVPGPDGSIAFGTDDENDGGWLLFR